MLISKEIGAFVAGKTRTSSLQDPHLDNRNHYTHQKSSGKHLQLEPPVAGVRISYRI